MLRRKRVVFAAGNQVSGWISAPIGPVESGSIPHFVLDLQTHILLLIQVSAITYGGHNHWWWLSANELASDLNEISVINVVTGAKREVSLTGATRHSDQAEPNHRTTEPPKHRVQ